MSATLTTPLRRQPIAPNIEEIRSATAQLLRTISTSRPDDRRLERASTLVTAAAVYLREAIGAPVIGMSAAAPPIVRERDLATAAHRLLARDTRVVDASAAAAFLRLSQELMVAVG